METGNEICIPSKDDGKKVSARLEKVTTVILPSNGQNFTTKNVKDGVAFTGLQFRCLASGDESSNPCCLLSRLNSILTD